MSKFNKTKNTKTTNLAGGLAFSMNAERGLTHAVLSTFLEDKFYESGDDRLVRIQSLCGYVSTDYLAKLAYVARTEFNLRSVSIALLGELGKLRAKETMVAVEKTIQRVDDITELVSYLNGKLPKQIKRGIRHALFKFNRYQLAKYKGEGKSVKLVDVFNLVHPKPQFANEEQQQAWKDLINGDLKSFDTWEVEISGAKTDEERAQRWEALIRENKLGYMALLRNLNNLIKYKVSEDVVDIAVKKLTDKNEVLKSKQLPFRFTTAFDNVSGNRKFSDAISIAMDLAVSNTPEMSGKTLIAVDCSGSMSGDPIDKASIFGATLVKANPNADLILYDTRIKELNISSRTPVIDLANTIKREATGGGTQTSLVFQYAFSQFEKEKVYDRIIIISDGESWIEYSVQESYNKYKKQTNTDPFIYAVDIQGYGTTDVSSPKVKHIVGWSARLLDFIVEGERDIVDYIKKSEIFKKNNLS